MTQALNEWKQTGTIFLWSYRENTRNFPGWHWAFDDPGLRSLIDLLGRLLAGPADAPLARTVRITPPTERVLSVPNNRSSRVRSPDRLRIVALPTADDWILAEEDAHLVLSLGRDRLRELIAWLQAEDQAFDTSFGADPQVWFWGIVDGG